jgi:hypothetical protein
VGCWVVCVCRDGEGWDREGCVCAHRLRVCAALSGKSHSAGKPCRSWLALGVALRCWPVVPARGREPAAKRNLVGASVLARGVADRVFSKEAVMLDWDRHNRKAQLNGLGFEEAPGMFQVRCNARARGPPRHHRVNTQLLCLPTAMQIAPVPLCLACCFLRQLGAPWCRHWPLRLAHLPPGLLWPRGVCSFTCPAVQEVQEHGDGLLREANALCRRAHDHVRSGVAPAAVAPPPPQWPSIRRVQIGGAMATGRPHVVLPPVCGLPPLPGFRRRRFVTCRRCGFGWRF